MYYVMHYDDAASKKNFIFCVRSAPSLQMTFEFDWHLFDLQQQQQYIIP